MPEAAMNEHISQRLPDQTSLPYKLRYQTKKNTKKLLSTEYPHHHKNHKVDDNNGPEGEAPGGTPPVERESAPDEGGEGDEAARGEEEARAEKESPASAEDRTKEKSVSGGKGRKGADAAPAKAGKKRTRGKKR